MVEGSKGRAMAINVEGGNGKSKGRGHGGCNCGSNGGEGEKSAEIEIRGEGFRYGKRGNDCSGDRLCHAACHRKSLLVVRLILLVSISSGHSLTYAAPESSQGAQQQARVAQSAAVGASAAPVARPLAAAKSANAPRTRKLAARQAERVVSKHSRVGPASSSRPSGRSTANNDASAWLGFRAGPGVQTPQQANAQPPALPFYEARRGLTVIYVLGSLHAGYPSDYPAHHPFRPETLARRSHHYSR